MPAAWKRGAAGAGCLFVCGLDVRPQLLRLTVTTSFFGGFAGSPATAADDVCCCFVVSKQ